MRKRWFLVGMIFLLVPLLLVGCGVAQEQYDAVVSELGKAQQELQTAKSDLGATQAKSSELTSSLEKTEADLEATQAELETAQAKVSQLTSSLEKAETDLEVTQAKVSELTSSLEKSQTELAGIKTENEALEEANTKLKRLIFLKTALCSEEPEPWTPKPKPDNTFKTNETVYVYGEITGWKYILVGQELQVNNTMSIKILDAEGKVVGSKSWTETVKHERPSSRYGFDRSFGPLETGKYTVEVEVTDNNSGEMITWEEEFQVVSS